MNNRIIALFCFVFLVLISSPTLGIVYVVSGGVGTGTSWGNALGSIQAAINVAAGDQVWVRAGTYVENITLANNVAVYGGFLGTENTLANRPSFLRAQPDPNASIIDGGGVGSVVTAPPGVDSTAIIDGFTLTNGKNDPTGGGGIFCESSSPTIHWCTITRNIAVVGGGIYLKGASPTIDINLITENIADFYGGGISMEFGSNPTITNNTITYNDGGFLGGGVDIELDSAPMIKYNYIMGNTAGYGGGIYALSNPTVFTISRNTVDNNSSTIGGGGGIYCSESSPSITLNYIYSNTSIADGGGICCYNFSSPIISGNVIGINTARKYGGGVFAGQYSSPILTNNTIAQNAASKKGGGIALMYYSASPISNNLVALNNTGIYSYFSKPVLRNNDFFNASLNYSGVVAGVGDIQANPNFVNAGIGDFHIQQPTPCYNAGWNAALDLTATDIDGNPRIQGGTVDIGAYELPATSLFRRTR